MSVYGKNSQIFSAQVFSQMCHMQVPRIALAASTFNSLLAYPAVPQKTMFLISINKAAGTTGSLYYTFGTGVPERSCVATSFIMSFLQDVQAGLQSH